MSPLTEYSTCINCQVEGFYKELVSLWFSKIKRNNEMDNRNYKQKQLQITNKQNQHRSPTDISDRSNVRRVRNGPPDKYYLTFRLL